MSAFVTLKLSPQEFDLVRESLQESEEIAKAEANDRSYSASERHDKRARFARFQLLRQKIGG